MGNKLEYAGACFQGPVRSNNEDNFWCGGKFLPCVNTGADRIFKGTADPQEFPAFAVFDGMGGESCGEMAAYLAAEGFDQFQKEWHSGQKGSTENFIRNLCQDLSDRIFAYAQKNEISSMGSTASMLLIQNQDAYAVNVGDSRIYRFCNHKLVQISIDHVCQSALYRNPPLTQFLGIPKNEMILSPHIQKFNCSEGESFLLCSDGLTKMFTDRELEEILDRDDPVEETVFYLQDQTLLRGAWDNTTILLCRVRS